MVKQKEVEKLTKRRSEQKPKKRHPYFEIFFLMFIVFSLFLAFKHFEDAYEKVEGKWIRKPAFKDKVDDKVDSFEECEVYYLLALSEGLYECLSCSDGLFHLYPNEIVKIGMTCSGRDRYTQSFYTAKNVRYQVVYLGNAQMCQQEEIRRLGGYARLPENLVRPDPSKQSRKARRYKLLYPVLNTALK